MRDTSRQQFPKVSASVLCIRALQRRRNNNRDIDILYIYLKRLFSVGRYWDCSAFIIMLASCKLETRKCGGMAQRPKSQRINGIDSSPGLKT